RAPPAGRAPRRRAWRARSAWGREPNRCSVRARRGSRARTQELHEFARHARLERELAAGPRMGHDEAQRVQAEARAGVAVALVAHDRMAEPGEVRADLVLAPALELDLEQRAPPARLARRVACACELRLWPRADAHV